jgi:hypothetical protein
MPMHENSLRNLTPWKPGQAGNPLGINAGRPKGSREKFSRGFLMDLAEVWQEKGRATMEHCATTNPDVFFATCARLIGPEVKMTIEAQPVGLEPGDIQILKAIRASIPNADKMSPEQVLQHVLDAVQAFESKVVLALPKPEEKGGA